MLSNLRGVFKAAQRVNRVAGGGGAGGGCGSLLTSNASSLSMGLGGGALVRHFSRKAAVNVRKINPKVPIQEAYSIAESLYNIIKHHGPLTVSKTWIHAKDASISGLSSKTHMKIMLKWMRGRKMLKLFCNQVGSSKKFLHCTLPEEPPTEQLETPSDRKTHTGNPQRKQKMRNK